MKAAVVIFTALAGFVAAKPENIVCEPQGNTISKASDCGKIIDHFRADSKDRDGPGYSIGRCDMMACSNGCSISTCDDNGKEQLDVTYNDIFEAYDGIKEKCGSDDFKGQAFFGQGWNLIVKGASKEECPEEFGV